MTKKFDSKSQLSTKCLVYLTASVDFIMVQLFDTVFIFCGYCFFSSCRLFCDNRRK